MDYYQILGIKRSASLEEIKLAYRKLAKEYHPDRNVGNPDAEERFKLITEAYNILSNSARKAMYDFSGEGYFAQPWVNVYTYQNNTSPNPQAEKGAKGIWGLFLNFWSKLFSKKSKVFTAFSIFVIILTIGLVSYKLISLTSHYYFNTGLKQYQGKQYNLALQSLEQSFTFFGTKNAEAYLLTAKILLEEYRDYEQALQFINKGLKLPGKKVLKAKLYYLKGKCLKAQRKFRSAYTNFKLASVMDLPMDSLHYELAELNCFIFKNYEDAIQNFNTLISLNPAFADAYLGRAYSFQQLDEHQKAVNDAMKYMTFNNTEGTAYYIKAVSEMALNHPKAACKDLQEALRLGMKGATELIAKNCR